MIAYIEEGEIMGIYDKFMILKKNGIGYKVHINTEFASSHSLNEVVSIYIYTAVRENSLDLYGFESNDELAFFELLLDVSGIGPKSALSILSVASTDILKRAIATGDTSYLNKVSGIGKKTAEKIVIELRDKLKSYKSESSSENLRDEGDVIEALKALGYSSLEARDTIRKIPNSIVGSNKRVKEALKILNQK